MKKYKTIIVMSIALLFSTFSFTNELDFNMIQKKAFNGDAEAEYDLAFIYLRNQEFQEAKYWFEKSAKQGYRFAEYEMGRIYYYGEISPKNYSTSLFWLKRAAKQKGLQSGMAAYQIGMIYYQGDDFVLQNFFLSKEWFETSIKLNNSIPSKQMLATLYLEGKGVKQNYSIAKKWFGEACKQRSQEDCDEYAKLNKQGY